MSNNEFRETVLHKIYEKTHGSLSECINRVEDIQLLFPQEQSKQVFNAVDYLRAEHLLSADKKSYINGNFTLNSIYMTSEGIKACEGECSMPKVSQIFTISGNSNTNVNFGDNNTQTIQTTENELKQLIQLVEDLLKQVPDNQKLIEVLQSLQDQNAEGKPSQSFLKTMVRSIVNIAKGIGGAVLTTVASAPIITALSFHPII